MTKLANAVSKQSRNFVVLTCLTVFAMELPAQSILEEVIVTAQKREESIQDVGIAITAFTGDMIDRLGLVRGTDIMAMTPGVHAGGDMAGNRTKFTIRGVVQNDFNTAIEGPVAVYVDEGYIAAAQGQTFGAFDIERVEIQKGPQGTLFGRNATGGVVHYLTRKPTREFEGYADVSYGSYDEVRVEAAAGGPLSDNLSGRISGMFNRHDEVLDNQFPLQDPSGSLPFAGIVPGTPRADDAWNENIWALRGQLLFEPSEDKEFLISINASRTEFSEGRYQSSAITPVVDAQGRTVETIATPRSGPQARCEAIAASGAPATAQGCIDPTALLGNGFAVLPTRGVDGELPANVIDLTGGLAGVEDGLRPAAGGDLFGYVDPDGGEFITSKDFSPDDIDEVESFGVTARYTWDIDDSLTLTSITDYKNLKADTYLDVDSAPVAQSIFQDVSELDSFSQEIRLNGENDRFKWVGGLYYLFINADVDNGLAQPANSPLFAIAPGIIPNALAAFPLAGTESNNELELETNSYSVFGQVDYSLNDEFTLIGGLRLIQEEKDYQRTIVSYFNTDDTVLETSTPNLAAGPGGNRRAPFSDSTSDTLWAGKLQLNWTPNDDLLVYAGVNRGVKAGGFNAKLDDGTPFLSDADIPYQEEVLISYETGFKSTLFDGTTRFNGTFYYYDYQDYQVFVFFNSSGIIRNADSEVMGIEFDIATNPMPGLDLMFAASFIDAEVQNLEIAPGIFRTVSPSFTPGMELAGLLRYEWQQPVFDGNVAVELNANYSSPFFHNVRNFPGP